MRGTGRYSVYGGWWGGVPGVVGGYTRVGIARAQPMGISRVPYTGSHIQGPISPYSGSHMPHTHGRWEGDPTIDLLGRNDQNSAMRLTVYQTVPNSAKQCHIDLI